jgi:phosphoribosylanthranilate isomerase
MTDDNKPRELREWTLVFTQYKDTSVGVAYDKSHSPKLYSNDNGIYDVIDKTELLYLQKEITLLRERINELEEKLRVAVEALEFYGFETASFDDDAHNKFDGLLIDTKQNILAIDNGKRARQTLAKIEDKK